MFFRTGILMTVAAGLAACTNNVAFETPSSTVVVRPNQVIDSLKCGLARAIVADKFGRSGLSGAIAKVEMGVNVILGTNAEGKFEFGIPIWSGSTLGSVTPSVGADYSEERKTNTTIDFNVLLNANNDAICTRAVTGHDAGFSEWIGGVVGSVNLAVAGSPKASMQKYEYETDFTVKADANAGGSVEIVPIKASASAKFSRSDIQHLKVTIVPVHCTTDKNGKSSCKPGAHPFAIKRRLTL